LKRHKLDSSEHSAAIDGKDASFSTDGREMPGKFGLRRTHALLQCESKRTSLAASTTTHKLFIRPGVHSQRNSGYRQHLIQLMLRQALAFLPTHNDAVASSYC